MPALSDPCSGDPSSPGHCLSIIFLWVIRMPHSLGCPGLSPPVLCQPYRLIWDPLSFSPMDLETSEVDLHNMNLT